MKSMFGLSGKKGAIVPFFLCFLSEKLTKKPEKRIFAWIPQSFCDYFTLLKF